MKKEFILCLILLFIFIPVLQQGCFLSKNDNYRQISSQLLQWEVIPLPESTINVNNPVHSLNGRWKLNLTPPVGFWKETAKDDDWADIEVPGEPAMQGYEVEHDKEVAYRKEFTIPKEFWGRRIFLRFDGVYSYAKVWVNGRFIREHFGGFTSWDCEITEHVKPGEKAMLTVGVVDRMDDMSYASGYAHHPIGGILRDVSLFCVPENYITSFDVETELDANYKNAVLKITAELESAKSAELKLSLNNPSGKKIRLNPNRINFSDKQKKATVEIKIEKPLKWDAEHPYLYTLETVLKSDRTKAQQITQRIGFREVQVRGNKILVNGKQVHLRGACRHDINPKLGRTTGRDLDLQDVLLAKEANINFIRTSHYPPSKVFLEYCDQYGIYVEEETAVCFVSTHGKKPYSKVNITQDDPAYTQRYLSQLTEMIDRDRNHACVIIWSIGNENIYGTNFQKSYDLVKQLDLSRPVMFSYPRTAGQNVCYEIESTHYPLWHGDGRGGKHEWPMKKFARLQRPVIADEWAHVACYPYDFDIKTDPTARNFWGKSLKLMWENAFVSNGTAGGAIWGMIDETFQLPDKCVGYGEWGIYDTWRRKKPEFWLTKKAYSPIRIDESTYVSISDGRDIEIPVKNWFDHTDFNELAIRWQVGDNSGTIKMSLAPGKEGKLLIPAENFKDNDVVGLCFYDQFGKQPMLIDEFKLPLREKTYKPAEPDGPAPKLSQDDNEIVASGADFEIIFDKQTGSIAKGAYNGQVLIIGGPRLNLSPLALSTFVLKEIDADIDKGSANIHITGSYGTIEVIYNISIDGKGTMQTMYSIKNPPKNPKSYNEVGIAFDVTNDIDVLKWERNGLYSVYPKDHIGRNKGTAKKVSDGKDAAYRERPEWDWNEDMHDFFYIGSEHPGYDMTHDFRSTKEHIYQAVIADSKTGNGLQLQSDGRSHAVRMGIGSSEIINKKQTLQMYINCDWAYTLGWGNIDRKSQIRENFSDSIKIRFINGSSE